MKGETNVQLCIIYVQSVSQSASQPASRVHSDLKNSVTIDLEQIANPVAIKSQGE